jgi:hypothetical protein
MVSTNSIYTSICCDRTICKVLFYQSICYNKLNIAKDTNLKRATKSLLEELNSITFKKDNEAVIESRATHVINSAINLLAIIKENFPPDQAYELERRFINSIKGSDPSKFTRGIRKVRDIKETTRSLKIIEGDIKEED